MEIDIIMPAYNCEKYVKYAINSVKGQTISNWKLTIIEDASTDNTLKVINKNIKDIQEKVALIKLQKNVGVAEARNIGIEKSDSRYIAFLDADDVWNKEKLEKQIKFMKENKYKFTYTLYSYLKNGREKQVKYFPKHLKYKQALGNTYILTSTVMIDTEKISKEIIKMPNIQSEDTATWWKILKNGYVANGLQENLSKYRVGINGLSSNKIKGLKKVWNLYRTQEKLPIVNSCYYFIKYLFHAIIKRIV